MSNEGIPPAVPAPEPAQHLESADALDDPQTRNQRATELVRTARAAYSTGDVRQHEQAWRDLFDLIHAELFRYALIKLPDTGIAEDAVGSTFFDLIQVVRGDQPLENARALAWRILRSRIADFYRQRKRRPEEVMPEPPASGRAPSTGDLLDQAIEIVMANQLLAVLPAQDRRVLMLRFGEDLSVEETASRLGLTQDQVKKRTRNAIQRLKEVIREQDFEPRG